MSHVGCIIEGSDLYDYMSGYKDLEMLGSMSKGVTKEDIDHAIAVTSLSIAFISRIIFITFLLSLKLAAPGIPPGIITASYR